VTSSTPFGAIFAFDHEGTAHDLTMAFLDAARRLPPAERPNALWSSTGCTCYGRTTTARSC